MFLQISNLANHVSYCLVFEVNLFPSTVMIYNTACTIHEIGCSQNKETRFAVGWRDY